MYNVYNIAKFNFMLYRVLKSINVTLLVRENALGILCETKTFLRLRTHRFL